MTTRNAEVALPPADAYARVCAALDEVGRVKTTNPTTRTVSGSSRIGLEPVSLRVSVLSGAAPDTAVLEIEARGQNVWGLGSRKVIDRLLAAI